MFRRALADDTGMAFQWDAPQIIHMWMKNTYIPLDMLFVDAEGVIVKLLTHAEPLDLTPLSSDLPVTLVVELNAGTIARLGLRKGDKAIVGH